MTKNRKLIFCKSAEASCEKQVFIVFCVQDQSIAQIEKEKNTLIWSEVDVYLITKHSTGDEREREQLDKFLLFSFISMSPMAVIYPGSSVF